MCYVLGSKFGVTGNARWYDANALFHHGHNDITAIEFDQDSAMNTHALARSTYDFLFGWSKQGGGQEIEGNQHPDDQQNAN